MRFLVDAQLPPALARWLQEQGHEAEHVADRDLETAGDREIWRVAHELGSIIVTKDEDFSNLLLIEEDGPPVVWVRLGNTRKQKLLTWFAGMLARIIDELEKGEKLVVLAE